VQFSRNELVVNLAAELFRNCDIFLSEGFSAFASIWQKYDALLDRVVQITIGDSVVEGMCLGVSARGAICVNVDGQIKEFHGGEASLRPLS
jgi:BirA family biotin operon repressor/biotin-[acetyl-CoA-carboxylase] ligase